MATRLREPLETGADGLHSYPTGHSNFAPAEALKFCDQSVSSSDIELERPGLTLGASSRAERIPPPLAPLAELLSYGDDYDDDFKRPTGYAVWRVAELLHQVWEGALSNGPAYSMSTLGDGGIRVHFRLNRKTLRLCLPAHRDGAGYIYHRFGNDYGTDSDVSGESLVHWIHWLREP
jgi:hypothetical protein